MYKLQYNTIFVLFRITQAVTAATELRRHIYNAER